MLAEENAITEEVTPAAFPAARGLSSKVLIWIHLALFACFGIGLAAVNVFDDQGLGSGTYWSSRNVFYFLLDEYERWFFILTIGLVAIQWLWWARFAKRVPTGNSDFTWLAHPRLVPILSLLVFSLALFGTHVVCLNFALPMDEYLADFQARILLSGKLAAPIPSEWHALAGALTPWSAVYDPVRNAWYANYLPMYAALRAPFLALGIQSAVNPLLAAISIYLVAKVCRKIWPEDKAAAGIGALLLASSSQFLVTSMTAYSMPAHLCLNLLWLVLFLSEDRRAVLALPIVGFVAVGLHQPNVHLLFVVPFFVGMLIRRRWRRFAYLSAAYMAICAAWFEFIVLRDGIRTGAGGQSAGADGVAAAIDSLFHVPGGLGVLTQVASFSMIWSWQPLALSFLVLLALVCFRKLPMVPLQLATGAVIPVLFYGAFAYDQGHGWGNRYFYPYLGNLVVLAVAGFKILRSRVPDRMTQRFVLAAVVLALVVQFPLRCWEVRRFTKPFADATRYLQSLPDRFVAIDMASIWYGQDLVRNSPFLDNSPKMLFAFRLKKNEAEALKQQSVRLVRFEDVAQFGLNPRMSKRSQP